MFNTYVINLEQDKVKYEKIQKNLNENNIVPKRFNAIYGKNVKNEYDDHLTHYCKYTCPKSVIGCGLSHILLSRHLLNNDTNEYALVLEDDAIVNHKNVKEKIENIVNKSPKDWEIIILYCQGYCKYYDKKNLVKDDKFIRTTYQGSFAAYLINKKGQEKLSKIKLNGHIDNQILFSNKINSYSFSKKIFKTDESESGNRKKNYGLLKNYYDKVYNTLDGEKVMTHQPSFFLQYKAFRIPIIDFEITYIKLALTITIITAFILNYLGLNMIYAFIYVFIILFVIPLFLLI